MRSPGACCAPTEAQLLRGSVAAARGRGLRDFRHSNTMSVPRRRVRLRSIRTEESMFRDAFERLLFAARFLLAPLYLALAISLVAIVYKSGFHLYELMTQLPTLNDEQVLLSELAIVDLTLTASLVVIVFLSGYTNFVAPVATRKDDGRPHWIAEIDFSELKLKLMASIVAISGIKLLEGFMNIDHEPDRDLYWLVGIHLTFVVSTIVLALAERWGPHTHPSDVESEDV